jgi:Transglutaminase-like superfamily
MEMMGSLARKGSDYANPLVDRLRMGDSRNTVLAIDRFLRDVFVYREEKDEVLRDVPFMLNDLSTTGAMYGDCDDMCIMCCAMLKSAGIASRMTAIKSESPLEFDHIFSEARIGTHWIPVDPTVPYGTTYYHFGIVSEAI